MNLKLIDRVKGSLFGCAIGDALGFPVEFQDIEGGQQVVTNLSRGVLYSDDTQMTIAVARGLLDSRLVEDAGQYASESSCVAQRLVEWVNDEETPGRAPGAACQWGCRQLEKGVSPTCSGKADGQGCGAAMRSAPYGWFMHDNYDQAIRMAGEHALMTHNSTLAQASAAAVAGGVVAALNESDFIEVADVMRLAAGRFDRTVETLLQFAVQFVEWRIPAGEVLHLWRGWTGQEAVAASAYCFVTHPDSYRDAVLLAVNSPGDSDSLGAITGAVSGAFLGIDAIPKDWVEKVENSAMLHALAEEIVGNIEGSHEQGTGNRVTTERDEGTRSSSRRSAEGRPSLSIPTSRFKA